MSTKWWIRAAFVAGMQALAGCAGIPQYDHDDARLPEQLADRQYTFENFYDKGSGTLVVFALSGGGLRSAAFSYGALKAAREQNFPNPQDPQSNLADRIDIISGVSGGSFTAAAFTLHAAEEDFARDGGRPCRDPYCRNFLTHDFNWELIGGLLGPIYWFAPDWDLSRQMAVNYGQTQLRDGPWDQPDNKVFGLSRTFGDLLSEPDHHRPFLVIQSTDIVKQHSFAFTQNDFDLICGDVSKVHVSLALAASNGVPVLLRPVEFKDHWTAGTADQRCDPQRGDILTWTKGKEDLSELSRLRARAELAERFKKEKQSVVLQDGGVADNLALRGVMNLVVQSLGEGAGGEPWPDKRAADAACGLQLDKVSQIVVVSVDGEAEPDNKPSQVPVIGRFLDVAGSALSTGIESNNFETLQAANEMVQNLADRLARLPCDDAGPARHALPNTDPRSRKEGGHVARILAHVRFADLNLKEGLCDDGRPNPSSTDPAALENCRLVALSHGGTSLSFNEQQVEDMVTAGYRAFNANRRLRCFLKGYTKVGEVADERLLDTASTGCP